MFLHRQESSSLRITWRRVLCFFGAQQETEKAPAKKVIDTEVLARHLVRQFGETVTRHELPPPPPTNHRKIQQEKLKVSHGCLFSEGELA